MGKSTGTGDGKSNRSSPSMTSTELPSDLTTPPRFAQAFYLLSLYRYSLLLLLFGLISVLLGVALLAMSLLLRSKTSSMNLLESVPLYMPGLILLCNGTSMVAFMHKHTRRIYLLKSVCALFLLVALLLIIVSVTTSVIHLPRLHSHRDCAYTERFRACTCVQLASVLSSIGPRHFSMEEIDSCELVHSIIYDSLRVVFALSLVAILTSVFSVMTLYQLYIHEKQKAYFKQLNSLRYRIHQRNILASGDKSDLPSNYLDHFNYLYFANGNTADFNNLPQVRCLSAKFSSQDLLIDQSSTNFGVSHPHEPSHLSNRGRIWSSQLSHLSTPASERQSEPANEGKSAKTGSMRRYMSVILERSGTVQAYVRRKLGSFSFLPGVSNERMDTRQYIKVSKSQLLPPHVTIARNSMALSIESAIVNFSAPERTTPSEQMRKSLSMYSSSSSSHKSSSTSFTSGKSKLPQPSISSSSYPSAVAGRHLRQTQPDYHESIHQKSAVPIHEYSHHSRLEGASDGNEPARKLQIHSSDPQYASGPNGGTLDVGYQQSSLLRTHRSQLNDPNWSNSEVMDAFKCIDEDDLAHLNLPLAQTKSRMTAFGRANADSSMLMESKPLICIQDAFQRKGSRSGSAEEMASLSAIASRFTFESQQDDRPFLTTFEEAFKNYYDSQHRISSQACQYYTLPIKSAKEASKRKGCHSRPERTMELPEPEPFKMNALPITARLVEPSQPTVEPLSQARYFSKVNEQPVNVKVEQVETHFMSEDEFPAIEPPADYKNAAAVDELGVLSGESKTRHMENLTNQLMPPYHVWVCELMDQMNSLKGSQPAKMYSTGSMLDEYEANGFVDDDEDEGGNTSTSQDIADFELELDDEPIAFIGDEEYKRRVEAPEDQASRQAAYQGSSGGLPGALDGAHDQQQRNLLKNTNLIRKAAQMSKANADYRFDGFRKGCFDEDDDSASTSTDNSISDESMHCSDESANSVTAEYIKPPTPFTNNYYVNN